jgi:hypothetical protein
LLLTSARLAAVILAAATKTETSAMIDRQYFDQHLPRQLEELGSARAVVVLHSGTHFHIERVIGALDQYVLLSVFPNETDNERSKELRQKGAPYPDKKVHWDQVAVPYGSISHVWLSLTTPEDGAMGFKV